MDNTTDFSPIQPPKHIKIDKSKIINIKFLDELLTKEFLENYFSK